MQMTTHRDQVWACAGAKSLIATAIVALCGAAHAQPLPNAGSILQQLPQAPADRKAAPLPPIDGAAIQPSMQALPGNGPHIEVRRFEIVGNHEIGTAELQAQIKQEGGTSMTLAQLEAVATTLTRYYRSKGYFVARAYVPRQEIKDGVVALQVVEGHYGDFILQNQSLVRDDIVQSMLDDAKRHDIVSLDTLERAMLIINDTPGSKVVRADVMPGKQVGTSDFAVQTAPDPRYQGYAMLDNFGSRYTGKERVSFNVDWNSPSSRGDRLSAAGLASVNGKLLNGRLAYAGVLSPSGWRGQAAVSRTTYELGDVFESLDAFGYADALDLGVTYPIKRTEAQTLEFGLNYGYKSLKDEIGSTNTVTPKRSQALTASLSWRDERRLLGADGVTQINAALSAGGLDILDSTARDLDQAAGGPHLHGSFSKLTLNLSRLSLLPHGFSVRGTIKHQTALGDKNLDPSERLNVSGIAGVMAYPSGELSGSDATLVRLELSRPLPPAGALQSQWSVFADYAQGQPLKSDDRRSLSDVGIGWSATYKSLLIKAYLAHRLDSTPAQSEPTPRDPFWIQAGWVF